MNELSGLQEFSSMSYCFKDIPQRVRRHLTLVDVQFTCLDAVDDFIVIGTNIGVVYWCNRKTLKTERLRPAKQISITAVKVVSTVDYMVACGDKNGIISIFIIPKEKTVFSLRDHLTTRLSTERFTSPDLHQSPISAMEWSINGQKLFTGDEKGLVVLTEVDFQLNITKSSQLLDEKFTIVQLSYQRKLLLVATVYNCVIYRQSTKDEISQIGQIERSSLYKLGAVIGNYSDSSCFIIFSARPKQCIWIVNEEGLISKIVSFKEALSQDYQQIPLLSFPKGLDNTSIKPQACSNNCSMTSSVDSLGTTISCANIEFNYLNLYRNKFILVHDAASLVLLNTETASVEAGISGRSIISVAVNKDEIFLLEKDRRVRRFAFNIDPYSILSDTKSMKPKILNIFNKFKEETSSFIQPLIQNFVEVESNVVTAEAISSSEEALRFDYTTEHNDSSREEVKKFNQETSGGKSVTPKESKKINKTRQLPNLENLKEIPDDLIPDLRTPDTIMREIEDNEKFLSEILNSNNNASLFPPKPEPVILNSEINHEVKNSDSKNFEKLSTQLTSSFNLSELEETNEFIDNVIAKFMSETNITDEVEFDEIAGNCVVEGEIMNSTDFMQEGITSTSSFMSPIVPVFYETNNTSDDTQEEIIPETNCEFYRFCDLYWRQFNVPFLPRWICVTNEEIFCGNQKLSVFHNVSKIPYHQWTKQQFRALKVSASPSGCIKWRLDLGIAYAYLNSTNEWKLMSRNVECIAVNETSVWYINEGRVYVQIQLNREKSYNESIKLDSIKMTRITCFHNNVWSLSADGEIYQREEISELVPTGKSWKIINRPNNIVVSDIALCTRNSGWIIDNFNNIYFTNNYDSDKVDWWQISIGQKHTTSLFEFRKVIPWTKEKSPSPVISSNDTAVYISLYDSKMIFVNTVAIMGHRWLLVPPQSKQIKWKSTAVTTNTDSVWCLSTSNDLFLYSTNVYRAVESPTTENIVCLSAVPDMLWVLTENGEIFVRRGINAQTLFGWRWEQLHVYRTENLVASFKHISVSKDMIWALDVDGSVYAAIIDTYAVRYDTFILDWIKIEGPAHKDTFFTNVTVGFDKRIVWALDNKQNVYVRHPILDDFPFGTEWLHVPEIRATHLTVCPSAVWAVTEEGYIYRRSNVSPENPIGEYWSPIPGSLSFLTAHSFNNKNRKLFPLVLVKPIYS